MSVKRKAEEDESSQLYTSTMRKAPKKHHSRPQIDPVSGQSAAFPGLDEYEIDYGEAGADSLEPGLPDDPVAYLKRVRNQAASIPSLLVAPNSQGNQPKGGGYFSDGVYIAAPAPTSETPNAASRPPRGGASSFVRQEHPNGDELYRGPEPGLDLEVDEEDDNDTEDNEEPSSYSTHYTTAKEAYTTTLLYQFATIRKKLRTTPPHHQSISNHPSLSTLKSLLVNRNPHPTTLASMTNHDVLRMLELITEWLGFRGLVGRSKRRARMWIWALLLRLNDVGTLSTEEVALVRDVGKKALFVLGNEVDRRQGSAAGQDQQVDEEYERRSEEGQRRRRNSSSSISSAEATDEDEEGEVRPKLEPKEIDSAGQAMGASKTEATTSEIEARATVTNGVGQSSDTPTPMVHAKQDEDDGAAAFFTLDMIITIVGEVYGQRDLLDARLLAWMPVA